MLNKKLSFLLLGIIIILVIGTAGTTVYLLTKKTLPVPETPKQEISEQPVSQKPKEPTSTQPQESTSTAEIDTADWKTYRSEKWGFEIKYPNIFTLKEGNKLLELRCANEEKTSLCQYPCYPSIKVIDDISVYEYEHSLYSLYAPSTEVISVKSIVINGNKGKEIILSGYEMGAVERYIVLPKDSRIYQIESCDLFDERIFNQILSTFQFIDNKNNEKFHIISPNKDSRWKIGATYPIQWEPSDPNGHVVIRLYNKVIPGSLGLVWEASEHLPNTGNYFFTVPKLEPGDKYQFVIFAYFPEEDRFRTGYSPLFSVIR